MKRERERKKKKERKKESTGGGDGEGGVAWITIFNFHSFKKGRKARFG